MAKRSSTKTRSDYNAERGIYFSIIIHKPSYKEFLIPEHVLDGYFKNWAYIVHDKDIKEEFKHEVIINGVKLLTDSTIPLKPIHYHIVVQASRRTYPSSINKLICSLFDLPSNCVSVQKISSLTASLRYLCHCDDKDKFQYSTDQIVTNNLVWVIDNFGTTETAATEYILAAIRECGGDYEELVRTLGISVARKYHSVIYMYFRVVFGIR